MVSRSLLKKSEKFNEAVQALGLEFCPNDAYWLTFGKYRQLYPKKSKDAIYKLLNEEMRRTETPFEWFPYVLNKIFLRLRSFEKEQLSDFAKAIGLKLKRGAEKDDIVKVLITYFIDDATPSRRKNNRQTETYFPGVQDIEEQDAPPPRNRGLQYQDREMKEPEEVLVIFTLSTCPYCIQAKEFLDNKGIKYTEYELREHPEKIKELQEKTGSTGVPQIFIRGKHVGGLRELREGTIEKLLR